jgi:DNA polymerase III subunit chi
MAEIAFHFNAPDKVAYACRLLRKAVASGAKVVVVVPAEQMDHLDESLWTFSQLEFLAHCRMDSPQALRQASPVHLASTLDAMDALTPRDVLLNLGDKVCAGFEQFARVIEVVTLEDADRQHARSRWKQYTDQGFDIVRHDLKLKESLV